MRTDENCKFKLMRTQTMDWYQADEVDKRIAELDNRLAEMERRLEVADGLREPDRPLGRLWGEF